MALPKSLVPPKGWMDYPALGSLIGSFRLLAFKVPLSNAFQQREQFTPEVLIDSVKEKGLVLGLVIDLTNTSRYYDPLEFKSRGVAHVKLMCEGHKIPSDAVVRRFQDEVRRFVESTPSGTIVGVHCTHGVNRTGYLICRYLVDCCGLDGESALRVFAAGRPPGIQRENYVQDVRTRRPCRRAPHARPVVHTHPRGPAHHAPVRHENYHQPHMPVAAWPPGIHQLPPPGRPGWVEPRRQEGPPRPGPPDPSRRGYHAEAGRGRHSDDRRMAPYSRPVDRLNRFDGPGNRPPQPFPNPPMPAPHHGYNQWPMGWPCPRPAREGHNSHPGFAEHWPGRPPYMP